MRIREIDGLRAIAMSMVVAQHCRLLPFGWTGVWLFYVISGYVITLGFDDKADPIGLRPTERLRDFILRRAVRILPVYLLYVSIGTLLLIQRSGTSRLGDLPYLLTMVFNWHMIFDFWPGSGNFSAFGHLWTLSVEEQFYLLFPLMALLLSRKRQLILTVSLIALGPLVRWGWSEFLRVQFVGWDDGHRAFAVYAATPCHFDAFLIGSLLAQRRDDLARWSNALWGIAAALACSHAIVYVWINYSHGARGSEALRNVFSGILYGQHREVFGYVAIDAVAAAVLVHANAKRWGSSILATAPFTWVGRVSYGGYLYHALVLWLAGVYLNVHIAELPIPWRVLGFIGALACTVAIASLSFVYFESPIASYFRKRASENYRETFVEPPVAAPGA